jgi:uncharacterized membrane-anchored protein YitT (DUF2179 family)
MDNKIFNTLKRLFLVILGGVIMAFNINTFVHAGGLLPGGFTGVVILVQEICQRYGNFHIPFSVLYYALNAIPAAFCFRYIGRRFTFYSVLMILVSGFLTDYMPDMFIKFIQLHDTLLSAVFGGIINGISIVLCLYAGASSGGTDFIAIYISEKYRKESWNYIFFGNCIVLAVAGILFSLNKALYSIIYQYVTTLTLGILYRNYQQSTLLIITKMPDEMHRMIYQKTNHGATIIDCFGSFEKQKRTLLYSVITATQVKDIIPEIKKIDDESFVNVIKTEHINGRFYHHPKD